MGCWKRDLRQRNDLVASRQENGKISGLSVLITIVRWYIPLPSPVKGSQIGTILR